MNDVKDYIGAATCFFLMGVSIFKPEVASGLGAAGWLFAGLAFLDRRECPPQKQPTQPTEKS
jgi:hypothetical protein